MLRLHGHVVHDVSHTSPPPLPPPGYLIHQISRICRQNFLISRYSGPSLAKRPIQSKNAHQPTPAQEATRLTFGIHWPLRRGRGRGGGATISRNLILHATAYFKSCSEG